MASTKYKRGKDGYFSARVWDGTYNPDGTKHRKNLRSKKSSKDLENIVKEFQTEVEQRKHIKKSDITFLDFAHMWAKTEKSQSSNNTKTMYKNIIEKHFAALEGVKLQDIDRIHVNLLLDNADGKKRTQQQIVMTFKQVMKLAVHDHLFPANVAEEIFDNIQKVKYKAKEKRPLTKYETEAVFKANFNEMDKIFVYIIYGCGLRREEALALTTFDINTKKKELTVNKAHEFVNDKPRQKVPKTNNGYRTVPIPGKIYSAIENYVNKCRSRGRTYLFVMRNGQPVTKSSYDRMWERILKRMQEVTEEQITGLTAHVFRHNYCSNLCYQIPLISIDKIAQLLGDSKQVVLQVYEHTILEKENAPEAVDKAFGS